MSGFEIVGVVLGTLPLVISALEHHTEGVDTIRRYVRYKDELASLRRRLVVEQDIFLNTCESLLSGLVPVNVVGIYLNEPGGQLWRNPEIEERLKGRLQRSYVNFIDTLEDFKEAISDLKVRLKLDPDSGQVQNKDLRFFEQEKRRLHLSLRRSSYEGQISRIERNNIVLGRLLEQNLQLGHMYAKSIYAILRWKCRCEGAHSVNLRLEPRIDSEASKAIDEALIRQQLRFRVVFCYGSSISSEAVPWTWEEAEVGVLEEKTLPAVPPEKGLPQTASTPAHLPKSQSRKLFGKKQSSSKSYGSTQSQNQSRTVDTQPTVAIAEPIPSPIEDLCKAITKLQQSQRDICLGFLVDEFTNYKHGIYPLVPSVDPSSWSVLSLRSILSEEGISSRLTRLDKLRLAVILASSVLQLHETPWLIDDWGKDDILFIQRKEGLVYEHPFVSKHFSNSTAEPVSHTGCNSAQGGYRPIRNKTLFALGVLLIELHFGKSLDKLRVPDDKGIEAVDTANSMSDWNTADRLVDSLYFEAGFRYGNAVRRCIRCDFDRQGTNLNDDGFREVVYRRVVVLLEEDLKDFMG
ncbi:hypothetical protein B7494_g4086 [Chlorociboria aeruginascens]|nr:hypothetical protein B7494_g4086 [Chlorociboria aeruginascens]